jgi:murein DD-endopeptidase MepM/ murein hydrolase activator NlpD
VDGVRHKVKKGETIFTIAKVYGLDENQAQGIVNYPFNEFQDDENFTLTVGQWLMVPDGVKPEEKAAPRPAIATRLTPNAGTVSATGSFIWPASGLITQGYRFYHKAYDIANRAGGPILAADSGRVIVAGWPDNSGYGNRVIIDHGNGYVTLYGHLSLVQVQVGQTVNRGAVIGQMGSTGRSTGTHCHFEIRRNGVPEDPGIYLK